MKAIFRFLVEKFGYLFEDFPLESGIFLLLISIPIIFYTRNNIYYIKGRVSILYYFFNLRSIMYVVAGIGVSQVLRGLQVYDSILGDFIEGMQVFEREHPIVLGGIISAIGVYLIYDKLKIADEEFEEFESEFRKYRFWIAILIILFLGVSMIIRNI